MFNKFSFPLSAVALAGTIVFAPMSASALSSSITYNGAWSSFVTPVTTTLDGTDRSVSVGPFKMTSSNPDDGLGEFLAWCFQLDQNMISQGSAANYTIDGSMLDTNQLARVQNLFDANYDLVLGDVMGTDTTVARNTGAAFQIAIWEAIYDGTPGSLTGGSFRVSDVDSGIINQAEEFLTAATTPPSSQQWIITQLSSSTSQDVGVIGAIPLPAAAWLLLTATGGLIIAKRRRQRENA